MDTKTKFVALLFFVASRVAVAADQHWYAEASGGEGSSTISKSSLDQVRFQALHQQFQSLENESSTVDSTHTIWGVRGGYSISPHLSFEIGYENFGSIKYSYHGTEVVVFGTTLPLSVSRLPITANIDTDIYGVSARSVLLFPISSHFNLHGALGLLYSFVDTKVTTGSNIIVGGALRPFLLESTSRSTSILLEVGAGYSFGNHWALSFDAGTLTDVGSSDIPVKGQTASIAAKYYF